MFPHDSYGFRYVSPNDVTLCFISINMSQFYRHRIYLNFHRLPYASDNGTPSFYGGKNYYLKKEIRSKNLIN